MAAAYQALNKGGSSSMTKGLLLGSVKHGPWIVFKGHRCSHTSFTHLQRSLRHPYTVPRMTVRGPPPATPGNSYFLDRVRTPVFSVWTLAGIGFLFVYRQLITINQVQKKNLGVGHRTLLCKNSQFRVSTCSSSTSIHILCFVNSYPLFPSWLIRVNP